MKEYTNHSEIREIFVKKTHKNRYDIVAMVSIIYTIDRVEVKNLQEKINKGDKIIDELIMFSRRVLDVTFLQKQYSDLARSIDGDFWREINTAIVRDMDSFKISHSDLIKKGVLINPK